MCNITRDSILTHMKSMEVSKSNNSLNTHFRRKVYYYKKSFKITHFIKYANKNVKIELNPKVNNQLPIYVYSKTKALSIYG